MRAREVIERGGLFLALALGLLVRLGALVLSFEAQADGPVRIEMAERWAQAPHLWRGYSEAFQFGPVHLSLLGVALRLWPNRFLSPQLLSLAFGLGGIALLYALTRRLRGPGAAFAAAGALAMSPMHIQASTTAASEAIFVALLLGAILLAAPWPRPASGRAVACAAALLSAATLVRYDGLLYVPLVGGLLLVGDRPLRTRLVRAAAFCAVAVAPLLLWLFVNHVYCGDALAPIRRLESEHRSLAQGGPGWLGPVRYRIEGLFFWPRFVLICATHVAGALALVGTARALIRRSPGWPLAAIAWLPVAYFTWRTAGALTLAPLPRFTIVTTALSLPFAWDAVALFAPRVRPLLFAYGAAVAVAVPLVLFGWSQGRTGYRAEWARQMSPVSSAPPGIAEAAEWLRNNARPSDVVLLDDAGNYLDIPLAFGAGLPDLRWIRMAWKGDFEWRWANLQPTLAAALQGGALRREAGASDGAERFMFRGVGFCREVELGAATLYRRCDAATVSR